MAGPNLCPRCGKPLPQNDVLVGRCPFCLLKRAFESAVGNAEEAEPAIETSDPAAIGRYRVLRRIGEGGMGVVYEAEQDHPRRAVALKIIKPGMATPELLRRFEQESQALGRLHHPGIAQIYEAGTVDTGFGPQPYFAMELIHGTSPRDYADAHQLAMRERLEIMAKICDAVHHAHQRGLIHRDLKPGNILIDESGQPKILDFGVARVTDSDARATIQTDMGQLIGTLAYMSPEQVLADPLDIDTRSDVYSLGVILYEFLSGRLPYPISKKIHETIQAIREEDPAKLSGVNRLFRGDIETIVAKALEKDRSRRYASAAEMAADIQRYLKDEPIVARPPSAVYQLQKFARRHRALVAGVVSVFIVMATGVAVSTWLASRAMRSDQQTRMALERLNKSERDKTEALVRETEQRHIAEGALAQADAQTLAAQHAFAAVQVSLYQDKIDLADKEWSASKIGHSDQLLDEAPASQRNWEWNYLFRRNHSEDTAMSGHRSPIVALAFDADGKHLRTVSTDNTFKDWDIETRKESSTARIGGAVSGEIAAMAMGANGRVLYSKGVSITNGSRTEIHKFWDLMTGKEAFSIPTTSTIHPYIQHSETVFGPVALSPDGRRVIAVFDNNFNDHRFGLRSWDMSTGAELFDQGGFTGLIYGLTFSPDSSSIAVVRSPVMRILDATTGDDLVEFAHSAGVSTAPAFSRDGATVVAGILNESLRAWKTSDGSELWSISTGYVTEVAFSPDSRSIAVALADRSIRILNSITGREDDRLMGQNGVIHALSFTPDGTQLVSVGEDKLVHIWNLKTPIPNRVLDVGRIEKRVHISSDGNTLLTSKYMDMKLWSTNTGLLRFDLVFGATRWDANFSTDGARFVLLNKIITNNKSGLNERGDLQVLDARTGFEVAVLHPPHKEDTGNLLSSNFEVSPQGDRAALVSYTQPPRRFSGSDIQIWEIPAGKLITSFRLDKIDVESFLFSPNGRLLALVTDEIENSPRKVGIEIYDTTTGRRLRRLDVAGPMQSARPVFSPDSKQLAEVENGRTITIWDAIAGARLVSFSDSAKMIMSLAFSPDGTRLASVSSDGEVWLWDTKSGKALIRLRESRGPYAIREITVIAEKYGTLARTAVTKEFSISFSSDGRQIMLTTVAPNATGATVRIEGWDGTPQRP